jgi:Pyridoxamine 5'-phosphate oxidase
MTNMPTLSQPVIAFIDSGPLAHVVTLDARGEPHVSMAWVGIEGGEVVIGTLSDQPKLRNLRRDPESRCRSRLKGATRTASTTTLCSGAGRALRKGGAAALLRRLAHVYLGPDVDFPPMPNPPAGFVIRMTVEKVSGNGRWSDE